MERWAYVTHTKAGSPIFPEILAVAGESDKPEFLNQAVVMAIDVFGQTSGWSEIEFHTPVISSGEGLYLILRFPADSVFSGPGLEGGAGLGYYDASGNGQCWLTDDGSTWDKFHMPVQPAILPVFETEKCFSVLVLGGEGNTVQQDLPREDSIEPHVEFDVWPNPFNPVTKIGLRLQKPSHVKVEVFDIRGRLVKKVISQVLGSGEHVFEWNGLNSENVVTSSGVYLVRVVAGDGVFVRRVTLTK